MRFSFAVLIARMAQRGQAEVVAQRGAGVVGAEHAALLQQRDDLVDERGQPARGDVRDQDVAVGGVGLDELVDRRGDRLRRADERLPAGHLDDDLPGRQVPGFGPGPPLGGQRDRVLGELPDAGPALGDQGVADHRVEVRQRAVDVEAGQFGVPQLLDEHQRGLRRDLGPAHLAGDLGRLGVGVAEHERGRGQDQQLVRGYGRTWAAGPSRRRRRPARPPAWSGGRRSRRPTRRRSRGPRRSRPPGRSPGGPAASAAR